MFEKIIRFAIEQRWFVMLGTVGLIALGIYSYQKLHNWHNLLPYILVSQDES